jgi:hypothetical protein
MSKKTKNNSTQNKPEEYFTLDEVSRNLNIPVSTVFDYGIRGHLTIHTLTIEGDHIIVPSVDLQQFNNNPCARIDISKLNRKVDYYDEYYYPYHAIPNQPAPKIYVSSKTLRIHEKKFTALKNKLNINNAKALKPAKSGAANFNDVKLEIDVDEQGRPYYDAYVSANNGKREKLDLEPRFIEPLNLLAKAVSCGTGDVSNNDINKVCNDGASKVKLVVIRAFKKIIGSRAKGIIETKHGISRKLKIPKKNITFRKS